MGKKGTEGPFGIVGHKGRYFYTPANTVEKLLKINEAYKELSRKGKVPQIGKPKIVGRGGALGFKPFLVGGERYLCILAEDLERLRGVNEAYGKLSKKRRAKGRPRA